MVFLRELDQSAVVRSVAIPWTRSRKEIGFIDAAGEVVVEHRLNVALEHLERKNHRPSTTPNRLENLRLGAMRLRVVVLLAEEHDIGARESLEHPSARDLGDCRR